MPWGAARAAPPPRGFGAGRCRSPRSPARIRGPRSGSGRGRDRGPAGPSAAGGSRSAPWSAGSGSSRTGEWAPRRVGDHDGLVTWNPAPRGDRRFNQSGGRHRPWGAPVEPQGANQYPLSAYIVSEKIVRPKECEKMRPRGPFGTSWGLAGIIRLRFFADLRRGGAPAGRDSLLKCHPAGRPRILQAGPKSACWADGSSSLAGVNWTLVP